MAQAAQAEACPRCANAGERVFTAPGITIKGAPIRFNRETGQSETGSCEGCSNGACALNGGVPD